MVKLGQKRYDMVKKYWTIKIQTWLYHKIEVSYLFPFKFCQQNFLV